MNSKTYCACLGAKPQGKYLDSAGSHPEQGGVSEDGVLPPFCPHGKVPSEIVSLNVDTVGIWDISCLGVVLCFVGYLETSLGSTH